MVVWLLPSSLNASTTFKPVLKVDHFEKLFTLVFERNSFLRKIEDYSILQF